MYIDTEGTFRPERLLAVAERLVVIFRKIVIGPAFRVVQNVEL